MRIIGKGKTAYAIKQRFEDAKIFDDDDLEIFDKDSNELTVVSPGVPPFNDIVKFSKNIVSDLDIFENSFAIWISGTNGKTTTTSMLAKLLKEDGAIYGGNIGIPVANMEEKAKIWIIEVSSFTLFYTKKAKPNIYLLLPISQDHISWHGSFENYQNSKLKPLDMMTKDSIAIVPEKFQNYPTKAKLITYKNTAHIAKKFEIDISKVKFKEPFLLDAVLSLVVSKIVSKKIRYDTINSFIQDEHKLEVVMDKNKRVWINDSKATNMDATIQAIKSYQEKHIHLILGGDAKDADFSLLYDMIKQYDVVVYCIGESGKTIYDILTKQQTKTFLTKTVQNSINMIDKNYKEKNSIAILSPACASFDQFESYKHRGDLFKKLVLRL